MEIVGGCISIDTSLNELCRELYVTYSHLLMLTERTLVLQKQEQDFLHYNVTMDELRMTIQLFRWLSTLR